MIHATDVLKMGLPELRKLQVDDFGVLMSRAEFDHILETCQALWLHSGKPQDPHALLTSLRHSDGFVDTLRMLRYANLCMIMAQQVVLRLQECYDDRVDWVIGSDHAGATLSFAVAYLLGAKHDFSEKDPKNDKKQIWKRFEIEPGEVVLQVEELVTTTQTLHAVRDAIRAGNSTPVQFAPIVMTLVHRSDTLEFEGGPIGHVVHYDIKSWTAEECPLCAGGSKVLPPKKNWLELTRKE
ncbi:MAG TPA: hypothetical protein VHD55_00620 [Candidatus Paceibacterota bacterium]|nr:hypothetical protein [Candidatus Paceibacterota bacterium]